MYNIDKEYCMSSFLALRYVARRDVAWAQNILPTFQSRDFNKSTIVYNADDINKSIESQLKNIDLTKTGIMLSGGMDSAILATYLPKGVKAYTMRTTADGSINEVDQAQKYAEICGLNLTVVDISWEDYQNAIPILAKHKKSPFHSIEPQIYKTLTLMKNDGLEYVLCGENADTIFGGMDGLLSRDWEYTDFINRYNYIDPSMILKNPVNTNDIYIPYKKDNGIDAFEFISHVFAEESLNSYLNVSNTIGIKLVAPFANMKMGCKIDLERIRNGESKYLIRELFAKRYPGLTPNKKIPMPRAVGIWLKDWQGPQRAEFKSFDITELKPDQKWLVYILEEFLNLLDRGEIND